MRRSSVAPFVLTAPLGLLGCGSERAAASTETFDASVPDSTTAFTGDASSDARPVDAPAPLPPCGTASTLPGNSTPGADGRSFHVACAGAGFDLTLVEDGVLRVHSTRTGPAKPSRAVVAANAKLTSLRSGRDGDALVVCTPELTIIVQRDCRLRVAQADGTVIADEPDGYGYATSRATAKGKQADEAVLVLRRSLTPSEHFYGLGLRTGRLDRRGGSYELWNTDAYDDGAKGFRPDADPLYESIPLVIGLRDGSAYGLLVDDAHRLRFDLGNTDSSSVRVLSFGGALDHLVLAGPRIADVVAKSARLTGRPFLPPRWALGLSLSRWESPCDGSKPGTLFCNETELRALAQTVRDKHIPADAVWLDIQHMDGARSFTWDPSRFSGPKQLVADLAAMGLKTVTIVDPGIKVDAAWEVYQSGVAANAFITDSSSTPFVGEVWPGPAVFPDFTAKSARAWWARWVAREAALGVRGLWIDMNEPANFKGGTLPEELVVDGDGSPTTMAEAHNLYALYEARASYEALRSAQPDVRPFLLSRGAFAGQQRYSGVWTGDAPSTWATLGETLPMLLSVGLSGIPIVGSDVGGYSGREESTAELYARWMALGSVSPFLRVHAEKDARRQEPWAFDDVTEDASRELVSARYELLPYLYGLFAEAHDTGAPVLRPLVYEFQSDAATHTTDDEAMLGPSLLVAPITDKAATSKRIYLPRGDWLDNASGAIFSGAQTIILSTTPELLPPFALPSFFREGAIVPRIAAAQSTDEASDTLYFELFPAPTKSAYTLYEDDGATHGFERGAFARTSLELQATVDGAVFSAAARVGTFTPPSRRLVLRLRPVDGAVRDVAVSGTSLVRKATLAELGTSGFFADPNDRSLWVATADTPPFTVSLRYDVMRAAASAVDVPLRVTLPATTPDSATISVATSANGWTHAPLRRTAANKAEGVLTVPRGSFFFFKLARGSWATVEKSVSCTEVANRTAIGSGAKTVDVTVSAWADACP